MDIRILGPMEVWEGSEQLAIDSPRQRSLLAWLVINANEVVSVDRIVDELWGESPPASAQSAVRYHVSKLRSSLRDAAGHVVTRSPGYVLEVDSDEIDAGRFEEMAAEGRRLIATEPERAARVLVDALGMWRGAPLADFTYESFARSEIIRLEELHLVVFEHRIDADLASGRHADLVGELEALVAKHPLRERLWGQLMTALYRTGRQAEALRAYQQARDALGEIGIEPSEELRAIEERVLTQDPLLAMAHRPVRRCNLPERVSSFVGRDREIKEVQQLLERHRLVTLTGVGGVGKTALAVEAVRSLGDEYPDGIWFIEVSDVGDPDLISERLVHILGIPPWGSAGPLEQLRGYLHERRVLLVLDSCERHIGGVVRLVEELTATAAGLRIVATSREPLEIAGEARLGVAVLSTEGTDAEAVRLFLDRAALVRPRFQFDADAVDVVAKICRRLAGIPLGIELAASRFASLSLDQIEQRLDEQMSLLSKGRRRAESHHDSLQLALDWSHDLLEAREQTLFRRLSVFRGGFTLEAASRICSNDTLPNDAVEDLVARLVDMSLVDIDQANMRFDLLDPVQQYAAQWLEAAGEAEHIRHSHATYYRDLAQLAHRGVFGADDVSWFQVYAVEESNQIAAITWALESGEPDLAVTTAANLTPFWSFSGRVATERRLLGPLLGVARDRPSIELLTLLSHASYVGPNANEAVGLAKEALGVAEALGDQLGLGIALQRLGGAIGWSQDMELGIEYTRRSIEAFDDIGHPQAVGGYLNLVGMLVRYADDETLREAEVAARHLLVRADEIGSVGWRAFGYQALGWVATSRGDVDLARDYLSRAIPLHAAVGASRWVAYAEGCLADLDLAAGNVDSAVAFQEQYGQMFAEVWGGILVGWDGLIQVARGSAEEGAAILLDTLVTHAAVSESETVGALCGLGAAAFDLDQYAAACRIYAAAQSIRTRNRAVFSAYALTRFEEDTLKLRDLLGADAFEAAWADGAAMGVNEVVALASAEFGPNLRRPSLS